MLQLHLSYRQFYCLLMCDLYRHVTIKVNSGHFDSLKKFCTEAVLVDQTLSCLHADRMKDGWSRKCEKNQSQFDENGANGVSQQCNGTEGTRQRRHAGQHSHRSRWAKYSRRARPYREQVIRRYDHLEIWYGNIDKWTQKCQRLVNAWYGNNQLSAGSCWIEIKTNRGQSQQAPC